MVIEGKELWRPRQAFADASNIRQYQNWLKAEYGIDTNHYDELWQWSVNHTADFWASIWSFFNVQSDTPYSSVFKLPQDKEQFIGTQWFPDSQVNYAEHLLRAEEKLGDQIVFHHLSETRLLAQMSWRELGRQVRIVATQLRALGVEAGDRVVSYMPNVPETSIAMMATVAIGAVWSSAAPEFGVKTVIERFSQIEPKVLFAADGYRFAGKDFSRENEVSKIIEELPSLEHVIWLPYLKPDTELPVLPKLRTWSSLLEFEDVPYDQFKYERVAHDHPLWIVFSSGTTGLPKAIVHSHVGILAEHLKILCFHMNLGPQSTMFFYSTTGWMMWNLLQSALLVGSAVVLYDGSPTYPNSDFLWQLASATKVTCFGASPTFVQMMEKVGLKPNEKYDLSALESTVVSGAPSTPEIFDWFYRCVKKDL
jgi:acetoacetyl-CoA synthetase